MERCATFLNTNSYLVQVTCEIIASLAEIQREKGKGNQSWSKEEKVCSFFSDVYAFSCCMRRSSLFFFSGDEVSEKVTLSRKFKEGVVQPILKVNIPLAINYSKPGKHFPSNKLQKTWVYKIKKNE